MGWGERSRLPDGAAESAHTCTHSTHSECKAVWCASLQQLLEVDTMIQLIVLKLDQNSKVLGGLCMRVCVWNVTVMDIRPSRSLNTVNQEKQQTVRLAPLPTFCFPLRE